MEKVTKTVPPRRKKWQSASGIERHVQGRVVCLLLYSSPSVLSRKKTSFIQYVLFTIVFAVFLQIRTSLPKDSLQLNKAKVPFAWPFLKNLSTDQSAIDLTNQLPLIRRRRGLWPQSTAAWSTILRASENSLFSPLFAARGVVANMWHHKEVEPHNMKGGVCSGTIKMPSNTPFFPGSLRSAWANRSCRRVKSPVHHRAA